MIVLNDYLVGNAPKLWYTIELDFAESGENVKCTATIRMVNRENYYYIMTPYGWNLVLTVNGTRATILCKGENTNWSYPKSGIDYAWNNFYYYGDAKREHVVTKTFTCNRTANGKLPWSVSYSSIDGLTVPTCGKLHNVSGIVDSGFPAYKKATVGLTASYPSVTSPNTNTNKAKHNEVVVVGYSANANFTSNDITKIQYSKDKKTWHTPTMYSNKSCTTEAKSGNNAGYFKMRPSANYGGRTIGEGEDFTLYVRRHHAGGESYYSSVVSKSFSMYAVPAKPSVTASKTISDVSDTVQINFGVDSNYNVGTDIVQYRVNGSTWRTGKTTSGSGSFSIKPSSFNVDTGETYKVEVRRFLSEAGYYSSVSSLTLKTYSIPTITGVTLSGRTVNANTRVTAKWNAWSGSHNESSTVKVEFVKTNSATAAAEKTVLTTSQNSTSGSFAPQNFISTTYDNRTVYLRFTRIHSVTKKSSKPVLVSFKALYRPLRAVVCNDTIGGQISLPSPHNLTWAYPNGQYGIVTGYRIKLYAGSNVITTFDTTRTSWSITDALFKSLKAGVWYSLDITPYYGSATTFPGPTLTIKNYAQRITGLGVPTILYPRDGGRFDKNKNLRVVIELPKDQNATNTEIYTYKNLVLNITQDGTSQSITFAPTDARFSNNTLQMYNKQLCFKTPITGSEIKISATVTAPNGDVQASGESVITSIDKSLVSTTTKGEFILSSPYAEMDDYVNSIYSSYNASNYAYAESDTFNRGQIIKVSDFEDVYSKVVEISETTSDCVYLSGREGVGFGAVTTTSKEGYIEADKTNHSTYLHDIVTKILNILE